MNKFVLIMLFIASLGSIEKPEEKYPKSLASFDDYKDLVLEIEDYRKERLIDLKTFKKMSKKENVIILDTRSKLRYDRKHLKGAVHLSFSDFTQEGLDNLIPDANTKILIYCNNNFEGDQIDFTSKMVVPSKKSLGGLNVPNKETMLALNIPTFINLYGYGYKNVYELNELVNVFDGRIEFEGSEIIN